MDLTLTRRGEYVVRAAIGLAKSYDQSRPQKTREVAAVMNLPLPYAPQILHLLSRAGLAEAHAGRQGGYRLTRSPEQISLLELIEAAEGTLCLDHCTMRGGPCLPNDPCAVHSAWERSSIAVRESLQAVSLATLAQLDLD